MIIKCIPPNYQTLWMPITRSQWRRLNRAEVILNLLENPLYLHKKRYRLLLKNIG
jgi:hypothetical protein